MENIKKLKRFMLVNNNVTLLTAYLGYKSTATIHMWVSRKRIPAHQLDRVLTFMKGFK